MTTMMTRPTGTCRCGTTTEGYHSGRYECGHCWDYRKLDRPAALHWAKALIPFFSNIDYYDSLNFWPDAGSQLGSTADQVEAVLLRSMLLLQHGPEHTWPDSLITQLLMNPPMDYIRDNLNQHQTDLLKEF